MNKLISKTVFNILDKDKRAREDDNYLIFKVVYELLPEIAKASFKNAMYSLKEKNICLEGITRARRKYFELHPEFKDTDIVKNRKKEQIKYYQEYVK